MYMHQLPDFAQLEKLFNDNGYILEVDLSNSLIIEKGDNWVEYDELPEYLQEAINKFAADNNLDS